MLHRSAQFGRSGFGSNYLIRPHFCVDSEPVVKIAHVALNKELCATQMIWVGGNDFFFEPSFVSDWFSVAYCVPKPRLYFCCNILVYFPCSVIGLPEDTIRLPSIAPKLFDETSRAKLTFCMPWPKQDLDSITWQCRSSASKKKGKPFRRIQKLRENDLCSASDSCRQNETGSCKSKVV